MFNIPIRKEKGIQAEDFVVPKVQDYTNPKMLYVITSDVMRNDEYFLAIEIMRGIDTGSNELVELWKRNEMRMYKRDEWKTERDYVRAYYELMDEDNRNSWRHGYPCIIQFINWEYRKVLPPYLEGKDGMFIPTEREEWSAIFKPYQT
jgi:hypothetical protein